MISRTGQPRSGAWVRIAVAAFAAAGLTAGCGGVIDDGQGFRIPSAVPVPMAAEPDSSNGPELTRSAQAAPTSNPAAEPADNAAHTAAGLYLKRADAEAADRRLAGDVIWLDVGCCAGAGAEQAVLIAYGVQLTMQLGRDTPFFVTGGDLRLAARVVDRLLADGNRRAYLVTP